MLRPPLRSPARSRRRLVARATRALSGLGLLGACSLSDSGSLGPAPAGSLRVLFIGNSLTYSNDLPKTVADLAASANVAPCHCTWVAFPDFALVDHLAQGDAPRALAADSFDFVVMQQGPSSLPSSRALLLEGVRGFAPLVARAGAKGAMFSVWPSSGRRADFLGALESYRVAADSIGGILMPASYAWLRAWDVDPLLPLYDTDGLHPSPMGTYLAALVIFQRLYGSSPVGVQIQARVAGREYNWSTTLVRRLQEAAASANALDGRP